MDQNGVCAQCDPQCATCNSTAANGCVTCTSNATIQANGTCWCNNTFFFNGPVCSSCFFTCLTCNNNQSTGCLTCKANADRQSDGTCICRAGFIQNVITGNCDIRAPCHNTCSLCSATVSATACVSCWNNAQLAAGNTCLCNTGFYLNAATGLCAPCHNTCNVCSGGASNQCTSCHANASYSTILNTCTCDTGYYLNSVLGTCLPCHNNCFNCSGGNNNNNCTSCKSFATLIGSPHRHLQMRHRLRIQRFWEIAF
jgi:hypothetical protein